MRHEEGVGGIFLTDGSRINRPTGSRKEKLYNKSLINRKYTLKSGCWGCYKLQENSTLMQNLCGCYGHQTIPI